ncbi:hypothetical protein ABBQ38_005875 [Trebouxia sp. C0009 RCD-2024]
MKSVMEECEHCLSQKADVQNAKRIGFVAGTIFSSIDVTIAWAKLAEDLSLNKLLSKVEAFMVQSDDANFWQSATHQLSRACLSRVLQATQLHRVAMKNHFATYSAECSAAAESSEELDRTCHTPESEASECHRGWCVYCCPLDLPGYIPRVYTTSETLLKLQEAGSASNKRKRDAT